MTASLLLCFSLSAAQQSLPVRPITAPLRKAGTLHLATGTWTRPGTGFAAFGDVIYNNTGPAQYFVPVPDDSLTPFQIIDAGRVPSLSDTGDSDSYAVGEILFSYCSSWAGGPSLELEFSAWNSYSPCRDPSFDILTRTISITSLPTSSGTQACWTIHLDFAGSTDVFVLQGDGNRVYDAVPPLDDFGVGFAFNGHGLDTTTGPVLFGDPVASPFGSGTTNFGYGAGPDGTGLGQEDSFWVETTAASGTGCYFFGGYPANPWAGLYLQMAKTQLGCDFCIPTFCVPAGANSVSPDGAILAGTSPLTFGTSQATFDLSSVPSQPGLLFSGANALQIPFGCGLRCVGGNIVRGPVLIPTGNHVLDTPFDMSAGNTKVQYWYRDPANFASCGWTYNLSNAVGW